MTLRIVFWVSLGVVLVAYAGYPLGVMALSRLVGRRVRKGPVAGRVSFIVAAHNEEATIERRVRNLLEQKGVEIAEAIVGSDGSTDRTEAIVSGLADDRVKLVCLPERRGKPAVLNACVKCATGEYLVFGDARQTFDPAAAARLVENFADMTVRCVSGELVLQEADGSSAGVGLYWKIEKLIRKSESRLYSTVGATGAIYAVRRVDWRELPADTLLDDVVAPLLAQRGGGRTVFEPRALAYDRLAGNEREWPRKVRTLAGNFQLLFSPRRHGNPFRPATCLAFLGHKVSRLAVPPAMVGALMGTFSFSGPLFWILLGAQLGGYAAALAGWILECRGRHSRFTSVPLTLVTLNLAVVVGLWRYLTGRQAVQWERSAATTGANPTTEGER